MISAEDEQAKTGSGQDFVDVVSVEFCDSEREVCGCAWITRLPNVERSRAGAIVFVGGDLVEKLDLEREVTIEDWRDANLDAVQIATEVPLERWSLKASGERASLELGITAVSPPVEHAPDQLVEELGVEQYEQICKLQGTVRVDERVFAVDCPGRRVHCWGEFAWTRIARWRTLYAVSETGRAISVVAALPASSEGHGEELRSAKVLDGDVVPSIEDVRLSTVFGEDGLPQKAGVELWMEGGEFPNRLGGEAICGTRSERPDHTTSLAFFRWSMDGVPAYGSYEIIDRR